MSFNVGELMFNMFKNLIDLTQKLYDALNYQISIKWLKNILNFFNASMDMPDSISLMWVFTGASALVIVTIIIYNIFKL